MTEPTVDLRMEIEPPPQKIRMKQIKSTGGGGGGPPQEGGLKSCKLEPPDTLLLLLYKAAVEQDAPVQLDPLACKLSIMMKSVVRIFDNKTFSLNLHDDFFQILISFLGRCCSLLLCCRGS